jgi:hypothetical protein
MSISTATTLLLVNTFQAPGTVTLPSLQPGRILIVKDQTASFDRNPCTVEAAAGDLFESGQSTRVLSVKGQTLELVGGINRVWCTLSDSQWVSQQVEQLTATTISTVFFSAPDVIAPDQAQQIGLRFT